MTIMFASFSLRQIDIKIILCTVRSSKIEVTMESSIMIFFFNFRLKECVFLKKRLFV